MDEVTFITMPSGTEQPLALTWVNVITAPAGQEAPRLSTDGETTAVPPGVIPNVPEPPAEVVHDTTELGVPLTVNPLADPGQSVAGAVAVGRAFTVTTLEVVTAVVQGAAPELITLTKANVVFAVSAAELIVVVPPAPITTLCGVPPAV